MSYFAIRAPFPARFSAFANNEAELIINFLTRCSFTASLNEKFFGADKFRIGRTLVFCWTAISGFERKFLNGGLSKGPATILFFTQWPMVSVKRSPCWKADFAFLVSMEGRSEFSAVNAPSVTVFNACLAIFLWWQSQKNQHFWTSRFKTPAFTRFLTPLWARYLGKIFQKLLEGFCL